MATDAEVLEVLRIKLAAYEGAGMTMHAKNVQSRIAQLEKAPAPKAAPVAKAAKPTVKKAVKATKARRKR